MGCEDINWIHLAQDTSQWQALLNKAMNLPAAYTVGDLYTNWVTTSFSRTLLHGVTYWYLLSSRSPTSIYLFQTQYSCLTWIACLLTTSFSHSATSKQWSVSQRATLKHQVLMLLECHCICIKKYDTHNRVISYIKM